MRGRDAQGKKYEETARVINLSSSGIFVLIGRLIQPGEEVSVRITLPTGSLTWGTSKLATIGNVVRSELQSDEAVGIAIKFQAYKFQ